MCKFSSDMVKRRKLFRVWKPREGHQSKGSNYDIGLSDDELFTGWWTEGSTPFRRNRTGTVKRIVFMSQKGDRAFMEWWCDEIRKRGYQCILREKGKNDFELEGDLASAWLFHKRIIEPRKAKLPFHKRQVHKEAMRVLPRQIGRGFGQRLRREFK